MTEQLKYIIYESDMKKPWTFFVDLKSAFDTVDHKIMFEKMEALDIN